MNTVCVGELCQCQGENLQPIRNTYMLIKRWSTIEVTCYKLMALGTYLLTLALSHETVLQAKDFNCSNGC